MESKHTSGPWEAVRSLTCGHLRAAHNYQVNPKEEWTDADLKLISAAPEMKKLLERVLDMLEFQDGKPSRLIANIRDLLEEIER
jgi:hypothetical protein